ncbi:hypothetical protein F5Y14DRAFT_457960 [Nemania sp. NC0429]|nr:hypothetical protein F5Y14DRAFT_457960 [Nemania sp. NC0429]
MCSTVIFQYRCGCAERVLFECPFSVSVSGEDLCTPPRHSCSKHHRRLLKKLFLSKGVISTTASIPSSYQALLSQSSRTEIPALPRPTLLSPEIEDVNMKEQDANESTTALDETCHDCWQRSLRLARRGDDDDNNTTASPALMDNEGEMENLADSRILREISGNRVRLPPSRTNSGVSLSRESSSTD